MVAVNVEFLGVMLVENYGQVEHEIFVSHNIVQ